ncbi:hypothetical protein LRU_01383 [Ligilactobacillus ruminis SPM0211]|uniref:Uncharacterized protein n=1 Tax=Ligilactobacillus ruminis SPM0211 TaxID=1040964 RepID=F7R121_9LACO|nr:hypothetical protein LRU_01383 [Ligilactobacillus ruminis SPM0211]
MYDFRAFERALNSNYLGCVCFSLESQWICDSQGEMRDLGTIIQHASLFELRAGLANYV